MTVPTLLHDHYLDFNTGSKANIKQSGWPLSRRSDENIREVDISVRNNPISSMQKRSTALTIPRISLQRILHLDLELHMDMEPNGYIEL